MIRRQAAVGIGGGSPFWGEGVDRVKQAFLGVRSWGRSIISMMAELEGLGVMLECDGWEARAESWGHAGC